MILLSKKVPNSEEYSQSGEVVTINNPRGDLQLTEIDIDGKSEQATSILPDGYTQVDYIESSGTQYIITDVLSTEATRYETVVSYTDVTNRGLMGASGGVYFGVVNGKFQIGHNGTDTSNITASTDTWYNITFSNSGNNYTMTVNGETGTNTKTTSYGNIGIFKLGISGSSTYISKAKIKIFKVYNNDVLNLNLVPCYRDSDSVVGMYDTVNNTFYTNSGTGNFTYGNVVSISNPDYPQEIETITGDVELLTNKNHAEIYTTNWTLTSNNTIKNKARNAGASLFKTINIKKGQTARLYLKLISKPTVSTTFTTYFYGEEQSSYSFTNFYNYNLNQVYTKTINVTQDTGLYVTMWGNSSSEIFEFQYWVTIDDTMTEYKPYKGITIALGTTELCKVGNITDELSINTKTGVVTKTSNIKKITLNGTETWSRENTTSAGYRFYTRIMENPTILNNGVVNCMANNLRGKTANNTWAGQDGISATSSYIQIYLTNYKAETVANFKTWLSNNNVTAYYKLATPVEEVIGTLSQDQLQAFKMAVGENTYQLSSDVGTSNLTITYEDYFDYFDFDKILLNGYEIYEQPNIIAKKQYANGRRKKIQTEYTDVVIKVNLGCFDGDTLSNYLDKLQDGEYQFYSLKDKQKKNANFIVTLPSQKVQSSANEIIVDDFEVILEKSSDVE